jgi:hypothetical protein
MLLWLAAVLVVLAGCQTAGPMSSEPTQPTGQPAGTTEAPGDQTLTTNPVEAMECTRFVAPDGSDGNPGTEEAPWATFAQAGLTAGPGDVVCFRAGTYVSEDVHLETSGGAGAPITFAAYPGEAVTLDGVHAVEAGGVVVLSPGVS